MTENRRRILKRDPNPHLFRPIKFRSVELKNRIMLSPMCQYSAIDGMPDDWHFVHLASRAVGGAALVFTEATHVSPQGRITPHCLGIWNDAQRDAFCRIADFIHMQGSVPGIQIGHAGRKASTNPPWDGAGPIQPQDPRGWQVIAPSSVPFDLGWQTPKTMDKSDIKKIYDQFALASRRSLEAGFKIIELHSAHGYLSHSFLSPLSNHRQDDYGGSLENRTRFLLETIDAIRSEWPSENPLFLRLSCTDWVKNGLTLQDTIKIAKLITKQGNVDLIDCSSGGNHPKQKIPVHPGYQIPFAENIKRDVSIPTAAVGLLHSPDFCEEVIANQRADLVVLGRTLLADPYWPLHAATKLSAKKANWPKQYERANIF